jgi:hypothetical protein|tara:strand:+ start:1440 stop:1574 length:135 start_codon:yes stop_codon:yes gene_type:complete
MSQYIIRLKGGEQIPLEEATIHQVSQAISIIRLTEKDEAQIKNP